MASIDAIDGVLERLRDLQDELDGVYEENEKLRIEVAELLDDRAQEDIEVQVAQEPEKVEPTTDLQTYEATFYTASCDGCSGITYSGHDVRKTIYTADGLRIIAVDPNEIALGTHVRVTMSDGSSFEAEASDIGGVIKGRRIDVLVATKDEAYRLGRQDVKVEILNEY